MFEFLGYALRLRGLRVMYLLSVPVYPFRAVYPCSSYTPMGYMPLKFHSAGPAKALPEFLRDIFIWIWPVKCCFSD